MRLRAVLAALTAAVVLAACAPAADSQETVPAQAADSAFPVTIEHVFGSTTVPARPERIVTLGWSAQDVVYALGRQPVGMPFYPYGGGDDGVLPWNEDLYDPEQTTLLQTADGIPLEQVAALRPDVILAPYEGFDAGVYEDLSGIAPTVAYRGEPWTTPWQEQTRMIGAALGASEEAEELIADVDETLEATAAEHPELAGRTFAYTSMGADALYLYLPSDPRVQLIEALGMEVAPSVEKLSGDADAGQFFTELSLERAPDIASDVLVGFADGMTAAEVTESPVYSQIPAVQDDAAVIIDDQGFAAAVSSVSVLSIPFALDALVEDLSTAAANALER